MSEKSSEDWHRQIKGERTLNDHVEDIHLSLVESGNYRGFLKAIYDEQAVEGSLGADNIMAAQMIREKAREIANDVVSKEKLATISKALGVVLRRYGLSRNERRDGDRS